MRCAIQRVTKRFPFTFVLVMVGILALMREWYPFSHFPMYARFENYTYYVYVTDHNETPLPVESLFGIRTANLKKIYQKELRRIARDHPRGTKGLPREQRREAGDYVLQFLRENSANPRKTDAIRGLKLYQVDIRGVNGRIEKEAYLVGEI